MGQTMSDLVTFTRLLREHGVSVRRLAHDSEGIHLEATFKESPADVLARMFAPTPSPAPEPQQDTVGLLMSLDAVIHAGQHFGVRLRATFTRPGFPSVTITEKGSWAQLRATVLSFKEKATRLESEGWIRVPRETPKGVIDACPG